MSGGPTADRLAAGEAAGEAATAPTGAPGEDEVMAALNRLARARLRAGEIEAEGAARPSTPRSDIIERAHVLVTQAEVELQAHPDHPEVVKAHALAELAEAVALRRGGYLSWEAYERACVPTTDNDALAFARLQAESELEEAHAEWDRLKQRLLAEKAATIDLTGDEPAVDLTG